MPRGSRGQAAEPAVGDDARERILAATGRCVDRYGLRKTTIDDMACEVGVSRPSIYRYFADRDDVLIELITRRARDLIRRTDRQQAADCVSSPTHQPSRPCAHDRLATARRRPPQPARAPAHPKRSVDDVFADDSHVPDVQLKYGQRWRSRVTEQSTYQDRRRAPDDAGVLTRSTPTLIDWLAQSANCQGS